MGLGIEIGDWVKQELYNGHRIAINYRTDQEPGAARDSTFINKDTWAQYTFQSVDPDHAFCIVGLDYSYRGSNFEHNVFVRDDNLLHDHKQLHQQLMLLHRNMQ